VLEEFIRSIKRSPLYRIGLVIVDLRGMIGVLVIIGLLLMSPFRTPALDVTYEFIDIIAPVGVTANLNSMSDRVPESLEIEIAKITEFFTSPELLRIELANTTPTPITDIELTIRQVLRLRDVSLESKDSRLLLHRDSLCSIQDQSNGTYSFPNLREIPPRGQMTLFVWGDFQAKLLGPPLEIRASANSQRILQATRATGAAVFIADHLQLIIYSALVMSLIIGITRVRRREWRPPT
jgi:hypothetical protein